MTADQRKAESQKGSIRPGNNRHMTGLVLSGQAGHIRSEARENRLPTYEALRDYLK